MSQELTLTIFKRKHWNAHVDECEFAATVAPTREQALQGLREKLAFLGDSDVPWTPSSRGRVLAMKLIYNFGRNSPERYRLNVDDVISGKAP